MREGKDQKDITEHLENMAMLDTLETKVHKGLMDQKDIQESAMSVKSVQAIPLLRVTEVTLENKEILGHLVKEDHKALLVKMPSVLLVNLV